MDESRPDESARQRGLTTLLHWLIREGRGAAVRECDSLASWWEGFKRVRRDWSVPIDQAVIGGVMSDRVGYAFSAGYQSAVRTLAPGLPDDRLVSLSVTEEGGGHPRAIKTTLRPHGEAANATRWDLSGHKRWATLACDGDMVLVVASVGTDADGKNMLRVAQVALDAEGVTVQPMPPPPFVPEVQHAELRFDNVRVAAADILPGDGYTRYVRPFRTIEDTHVSAAILGHMIGIGLKFDWPRSVCEEALGLVASLRGIGTDDPSSPEIHVILGGFFTAYRRWLHDVEPLWERVDPALRARWQRDVGLVNVAGNVRSQRLDAAWARLGRG